MFGRKPALLFHRLNCSRQRFLYCGPQLSKAHISISCHHCMIEQTSFSCIPHYYLFIVVYNGSMLDEKGYEKPRLIKSCTKEMVKPTETAQQICSKIREFFRRICMLIIYSIAIIKRMLYR